MIKKSIFFCLLLYINSGSCLAIHSFALISKFASPTVEVVFPGLLGNRLFAYCVCKIVAEELGFKVYSQPIWGFPDTYECIHNKPSKLYPTESIFAHHDIDIKKITDNKTPRNIRIQGFLQRGRYFEKYSEQIRKKWLRIDPSLVQEQDLNDIVLHIRTHPSYALPFQYYKDALDATQFKRLFICTDEPNDPFLANFTPYNPIIKSTRSLNAQMASNISWDEISKVNMDDFLFILSFNKIILSQSTYAWWAGYLSNAQEIYAPFDHNVELQVYGKIHEPRYHYIETKIGSNS